MSERKLALEFLAKIKDLQEINDASLETTVRAIAMQSAIFEKLEPVMWEFALADARLGMDKALPGKIN